jgi:hypothetical protein
MDHSTWVHENNSRILSVWLSLTQLAKMLCLSYAYVFSSTKSVTGVERDLPETEEGKVGKVGEGAEWKNDPNKICTCE